MKFKELINDKNQVIRSNIKLTNINGFFNVYKVKTKDLTFNPYNDRFAKEIKIWELEKKQKIGFDKDSQLFLLKLLLNISKNKITKKDIIKNGLIRNIVIDANGVIIDGNRRVSILREIILSSSEELVNKFSYAEVVIIPRVLSSDEIDEYETKLQIAEDEKLEYDVVNMYLKVDKHINKLSKNLTKKERYQKVASLLGSKYSWQTIQKMDMTFQEMKLYLKTFLNQEGRYDFLDGKDDQFKQLSLFNQSWSSKKVKTNYPLTFPNFKRLKEIFYILISMGLRANPNFRDLVPKTSESKTPLSRIKGVDLIENRFKEINIKKFIIENPGKNHKVYNSNYWAQEIINLNTELNNNDPIVKYRNKIIKVEGYLIDIYNALKNKEISSLDEDLSKSIKNAEKLLKVIKEKI